jgi:prephenate dehydrogenase
MKKKIAILGINGGFGALFSRQLFKEKNADITGVDLAQDISPSAECLTYIPSDVTMIRHELRLVIEQSDVIIICLPEEIAYKFLQVYEPYILRTALLVDTLSIKRKIASVYTKNNLNALSLNPMFGPDLPIKGNNMVVIKFNESQISAWFIGLLNLWGVKIVYTTSDQHDQISSFVQVATHAAIMAFGITVNNADFPTGDLLKVATPPFLSLITLFGRIVSGSKEVYWNIQQENVYASGVRKALIKNLIELDKSIDDGNQDAFKQLIEAKADGQKEIYQKLADHFSMQLKGKI